MRIIRSVLRFWLVMAAGLTVVFGVIYACVQQVYRSNADDPQIQIAEDTAYQLGSGLSVDSVVPHQEVDLAESLASYVIVFDRNGAPIGSNARLDGQIPEPPQGVLDYAEQHGENRITWQPKRGVRSAIVVMPVSGQFNGYVLVGRSLKEVENRESDLVKIVGLGWLAALCSTLILTIIFELVPFTRSV